MTRTEPCGRDYNLFVYLFNNINIIHASKPSTRQK